MLKSLFTLRLLLATLLVCLSTTSFAVVWEETDTASADDPDARPASPFSIDELADDVDIFSDIYMQPSYDDPIVEIGSEFLYPFYSIDPFQPNRVNFTTGMQTFLTANLNWKWLRVGYSYPLADYTHGYDLAFSPRIANFLIDLGLSRIRNYRVANTGSYAKSIGEEQEDIQLDGLETFEWRCNLEWIMNKTYFSASSAFSQSYSSGQRVSAGSMLCGVAFGENRFKLDPSSGRSDKANAILANLPMQDNRIYNMSLGCGYGYNFVVRQGVFVVGLLFVPYFALARASYQLNGVDEAHACFGLRCHGRINCVYQYRYGFITLASNWKGLYLNDNYFSYFQNNPSVTLSFALKLGELGVHHEKVPGHQVIDFLGNLF